MPSTSAAFRYGDGIFETMLVRDSRIRLASYHFDRLFSGLGFLRYTIPPDFTRERLEREIMELCTANGHPGLAKVRLVVFRGPGAIFDRGQPLPQYIIESSPLTVDAIGFNEKGLVIDIFPDGLKACDPLASLKSNNYLLYVLAGSYAHDQGLDECLVLNSRKTIADSAMANLFYIKDGQVYTPPLSDGGVAGVMRRHLLTTARTAGFTIRERTVTIRDLQEADEVFLTNALRGIRWVAAFREVRYSHTLTSAIHQKLAI